MSTPIKITYTDRLKKLLDNIIENENNYLAWELLWLASENSKYHNGLKISSVDVGNDDFEFLVTIGDAKTPMKVGKFIRFYFPGLFNDAEIIKFVKIYNNVKGGRTDSRLAGRRIDATAFKYNPLDPRSTFLSLVRKTYPHGHEREVLEFLPNLEMDKHGNYYKIIGSNQQPESMFTSHLDTADRLQGITTLFSRIEDGDEIIYTDGSTVLGADDKSGVTVMLYMMAKNVPGLYYFFIGEERGGIGSRALANSFLTTTYLKNVKRCISFDRRRTISIITAQMGRRCCSDSFGNALSIEYKKGGLNLSLDNGGVFTDSASFIDDIPECTNISVGYENEHTGRELQNMTYLDSLCKASVLVEWDKLPTDRKTGLNTEILDKYKSLISEIKKSAFEIDITIGGYEDEIFIRVDIDGADISTAYENLQWLNAMLNKSKVNGEVILYDGYFKINLI